MINCPVCKKELKGISCEGQEIDLCLKCGGVWFDNGELLNVVKSLISKNEVTSQTIQEAYGSKIISRDEFNQIHKFNYETFVEEIGQHNSNKSRSLVDTFNNENIYYIAKKEDELVGMIALRDKRPFSLDKKIEDLDMILPKISGRV